MIWYILLILPTDFWRKETSTKNSSSKEQEINFDENPKAKEGRLQFVLELINVVNDPCSIWAAPIYYL